MMFLFVQYFSSGAIKDVLIIALLLEHTSLGAIGLFFFNDFPFNYVIYIYIFLQFPKLLSLVADFYALI